MQTTPGNTLPNVHNTPMCAGRPRPDLSAAPILLFLMTGRAVRPPSPPPAGLHPTAARCHPAAACKPARSTQPCTAQCACKPPLNTAPLSREIQTPPTMPKKKERVCVFMFVQLFNACLALTPTRTDSHAKLPDKGVLLDARHAPCSAQRRPAACNMHMHMRVRACIADMHMHMHVCITAATHTSVQ